MLLRQTQYKVGTLSLLSMVFALWATVAVAGANEDLIEAATKGDLPTVKRLIAWGADVNARNIRRETALMFASRNGSKKIVQLLIAKEADVNARSFWPDDQVGGMQGHRTGQICMAMRKNYDWETALMMASKNGHKNIVELLLACGADVNAKTGFGETALFAATLTNQKEIVKLLLAEGADINVKNLEGETALDIACERDFREVAALLLKARAG
jgi:ankyrin repeat protein